MTQDRVPHRIDAPIAQQINSAVAAKIENQTATPRSEAGLRLLMEGISTGKPNFARMSPAPADATRQQLPQLEAAMAQLGAVKSVELRGVGNQGWDIYEVKHERGSCNGELRWMRAASSRARCSQQGYNSGERS